MMKPLVLAIVLSACGAAKYALLPQGNYNTRDPDLTRPLVPSPGNLKRPEAGAAPSGSLPGDVSVGPVSLSVTGAAVLGWLLGGAAPMVGIYGEFDENHLVDPNAPQPPIVHTEQ